MLIYFYDKNTCWLPWFLFLLSPASCMCQPVSRQSRFSLIFFVQQELEPEPEPRARIRFQFRFFLGQNDTVPVPAPAPVPQHWCIVYWNCPKNNPKGKIAQSQGDCLKRVHSHQMVLATVRREARPCERLPNSLKTNLAQGWPSGWSPLRSDGSWMARLEAGLQWRWSDMLKGRVGKQL